MLLATAIFVSKWAGVLRAAAYVALLVLLLYAVTAGIHFEHWYSLLGEGPAALLVIAGTSALAVQPARRSWIFASGLLFGLAVTAKLLAALSFSSVGVWFLWRFVAAKGDRARRFVDGLIALGAFCLPAASFELWKMASLGWSGYLANLREFRAFFSRMSSDHASTSAFWRADGYSGAMQQHFGFSAPLLLVVLVGCAIPFYFSIQDLRARRLFTWLAAGAMVNAAWWLFMSIGWPRYALIGLCLYFAALACVVFFVRARWAVAVALSILLLFAFDCGLSRLEAPVKFVAETRYRETPRIRDLLKTASLLEHLENERPFVMSWWGTAIDSEYALPTVENFVRYDHVPEGRKNQELILVRNEFWVDFTKIPEFTQWEHTCSQVLLDAPPFVVSRCAPNSTLALK